MLFISKQKFNLADARSLPAAPALILTIGLEEYLAALYRPDMFLPEFYAKHYLWTLEVEEKILEERPAVLLIDTDTYFKKPEFHKIISQVRRTFPGLPILTIGLNSDAELVKQLMALGVAGHINRKFSRPEDVVTVVKTVLNI
jgi:hypothetical protein